MKIKVVKISSLWSFESLTQMKRQLTLKGDKAYGIQLHLAFLCFVGSIFAFALIMVL